jgi:hypothetical protein
MCSVNPGSRVKPIKRGSLLTTPGLVQFPEEEAGMGAKRKGECQHFLLEAHPYPDVCTWGWKEEKKSELTHSSVVVWTRLHGS